MIPTIFANNGPGGDPEPLPSGIINRDIPFKLESFEADLSFAPFFPPDRVRIKKKRQTNKSDRMCEGQEVSDTGSKNRVVHVSGILRGWQEVEAFDSLLDHGEELELDTQGHAWEGEVMLENGEYEGPVGVDQQNKNLLHWQYSMDVVSTGLDEYGRDFNNGILDDGT